MYCHFTGDIYIVVGIVVVLVGLILKLKVLLVNHFLF